MIVSICFQVSSPKRDLQAAQVLRNKQPQHLQHLLLTQGAEMSRKSVRAPFQDGRVRNSKCRKYKVFIRVSQISAAAGTFDTLLPPVIPCSPAGEGQSGPSSGPSAAAGTFAGSLGICGVSLLRHQNPTKASGIQKKNNCHVPFQPHSCLPRVNPQLQLQFWGLAPQRENKDHI